MKWDGITSATKTKVGDRKAHGYMILTLGMINSSMWGIVKQQYGMHCKQLDILMRLKGTILSFSSSIRLWSPRSCHCLLNSHDIHQFFPEYTCKLDHSCWEIWLNKTSDVLKLSDMSFSNANSFANCCTWDPHTLFHSCLSWTMIPASCSSTSAPRKQARPPLKIFARYLSHS